MTHVTLGHHHTQVVCPGLHLVTRASTAIPNVAAVAAWLRTRLDILKSLLVDMVSEAAAGVGLGSECSSCTGAAQRCAARCNKAAAVCRLQPLIVQALIRGAGFMTNS